MTKANLTETEVKIILASLRTQLKILDKMEMGKPFNKEDIEGNLQQAEDALMTQTNIYESDMLVDEEEG
jgi:hypothetical protein